MTTFAKIKLENGDRPLFAKHFHGTSSSVSVFTGTSECQNGFDMEIPLAHLPRWIERLTTIHQEIRREIDIRKAVDDGGATDLPGVPGDAAP